MVVDAASHGIIDPGSKADIRPAYQPPLPSPRRPLPTSLRVVPWSLPLEDYGVGTSLSSPIELDTEPRRGVCRTLIRTSPLSYPSPLSSLAHLGLLHVGSASSLILGTNFRGSFKTTRAPDRRILHLSAFSIHVHSFFLPLSEFFLY